MKDLAITMYKSKIALFRNVFGLWLGSILGAGMSFLTQVMLARGLGPDEYGVFSSSLSLITLLCPLAAFGLAQFLIKTFGEEGWGAIRWCSSARIYSSISTTLVIVLLVFWAFWGPNDSRARFIIFCLVFYIPSQLFVELVGSRFQLEENYRALAAWQFFPHLFRFLVVLLLISGLLTEMKVESVALSYVFVSCGVLLALWRTVFEFIFGKVRLKGHGFIQQFFGQENQPTLRDVLKGASPFGLATLFHLIYFQSDVVLLKYIVGDSVAGIYNAAFMVLSAIYLIPGVLYQKYLLPKIHRMASYDRSAFYKVYRKGNVSMLLLGGAATLMCFVFSDVFFVNVFGDSYSESALVLKIISLSCPFIFFACSTGAVLATKNHMPLKVKLMAMVAAFNVLVNFVLIPNYGALGAAISTVFSNILLSGLYFFASERHVFWDKDKILKKT